jgi:pyridoxal phosphate-dependent aminotransferase EpsN
MLLSRNRKWIERARYLASQAREPCVHYEHREVGFNYRMSNVLAGLGCSQLADLGRRIEAKRANFDAYADAFQDIKGLSMMPLADPDGANYWLTCLTFTAPLDGDSRERLLRAFDAADIEARPLWKPLHLQPVFADAVCYGGSVCAELFEKGLCLPSGSALSAAERARVIDVVRSILG